MRSYYPEGTETANDFTPKLFDVSGSGTGSAYRYDLGLAQRLVQASDYDGRALRFCYPTDVSLPYLQEPEAIYARIAEGLTKVFYPEASNIVIFVIMAIVLLVRPAGLFGRRA